MRVVGTDLEASAKDTDDTASEMDRGDFGHVLRSSAERCAETKNEASSHQTGDVGRVALHEGGDDGEQVTDEIDASSTVDITERQKGRSHKDTDLHEGIDGANDDARVFEAVKRVPAVEGVDAADHAPVDAVACLVAAHDEHDEGNAQARAGANCKRLGGLAEEILLGDARGYNLADVDAELARGGDVVMVSGGRLGIGWVGVHGR